MQASIYKGKNMKPHMKYLLTIILFFSSFAIQADPAEESAPHKTVCLNMIVKNESKVITRCLNSTLPMIDYWVIVDTGSTDGTQEIIKDFMKEKGIPGELHESPWVNFAHNRNEALRLAKDKGDYVFFIDADEYFVYKPDFKLPELSKDSYYIFVDFNGLRYVRTHLINNHLDWEWIGVLHEYLESRNSRLPRSIGIVEGVTNHVTTEGDRSQDPKKFQKDAMTLETALKDDPTNSRNVFYLAQSYRDGGEAEQALKNYEKRATMGGWDEEVFVSLLQVAKLQERLKRPSEDVISSYKRAYQYRPSRAEPLYYLAGYYRKKGEHDTAYRVATLASTVGVPKDILFVEMWIYDYGVPLELSACAYWTQHYEECQKLSLELLNKSTLPETIRKVVQDNLYFTNAKLLNEITNTTAEVVNMAQ